MKKTAALLGLLALAGGVGSPSAATVTQSQQVERGINVRDQKEPEMPIKPVRRQNLFSGFAPGYDIIAPGIPPKIYGMHYVRKGTHKRTNK